ncbi:MAG: hypothetical protein KJI72_00135 [Patescibacteria group bacterium]|nr:hypothetical protein [Patescibacteria group bacterium]
MNKEINTHNLIVNFGKHKGQRWTRIPISYLQWLANEVDSEKGEIAKAELKRRGVTMPTSLRLSGHSIDRASQITTVWAKEGVYSWLQKTGEEALKEAAGKEEVSYKHFKFVFVYGEYYPTLKTIIQKK